MDLHSMTTTINAAVAEADGDLDQGMIFVLRL